MRNKVLGLEVVARSMSFKEMEVKSALRSLSFKRSNSGIKREPQRSLSFKIENTVPLKNRSSSPYDFASPRPLCELDAAAVKLQKVYKSYRTRRNLADCAVVAEELWGKALDYASLKHSSISFFDGEKHETAVSRWARARTRAAKVGKGLSKDENAQKLALQHWLEAIDPRHRYGHNLHLYYDIWFESKSTQPFFYWLDVGDGREVNIGKCPRSNLQQECIKYLGPNERSAYEVVVEEGKLMYRQSEMLVNTVEGSKWIFVLSTSRALYVGQKRKGSFQHSSFLAGGAATAAGRMVVKEGVLKATWPYSGHYLPTEENFEEFLSFLRDNDLTNVKRCSIDDDDEIPSIKKTTELAGVVELPRVAFSPIENDKVLIPSPWPSPNVRLSPRLACMGLSIRSPRPSPNVSRPSPRLAYMGFPTPTINLTLPQSKRPRP